MRQVSSRPTGHLQVKAAGRSRTRSFYAYWRDSDGARHGRRLGPAHVKDSGRRTSRGAVIWRAGDGAKPTPEHLTPREAEDLLQDILVAARKSSERGPQGSGSLRGASDGWLSERAAKRDLRRSTVACYEDMLARMCRDLGADTSVGDLQDGRLLPYFEALTAERGLGSRAAQRAREEGHEIFEIESERWTAQRPGSEAFEVPTKAEAIQLAAATGGTWKHRRPCVYRIVPAGATRPQRVSRLAAERLRSEGWIVRQRLTKRYVLRTPASPLTHNKYRDLLAAVLEWAMREGWIDENPALEVERASTRASRRRILRRDDFYNPDEVARVLAVAPAGLERAFWLCGAHAGLRLPGEALGLRWGAVDFAAGVIRPYDNWVLNEAKDTKTAGFAPIPMTPRLRQALAELKSRDFATADDDFVFASDRGGAPVSAKAIRAAFKNAQATAGLREIPMYNLRHSFGTALASNNVDIRSIQALMRHDRITTTEQYVAYAPHPELASQITRALEPQPDPLRESFHEPNDRADELALDRSVLERMEEEIPAKWLREMQRLLGESRQAEMASR